MALFFDQDWFEARLNEAGRTHDALAHAAGLTPRELAAVWKDQMEITREMVAGFASFLDTDPRETASRCGVSTQMSEPVQADAGGALDQADLRALLMQVLTRLDGIDQNLAALHKAIASQPSPLK